MYFAHPFHLLKLFLAGIKKPQRRISSHKPLNYSPLELEADDDSNYKRSNDSMDCLVCYNNVSKSNIIYYGHKHHEICIPCFRKYLETQIMSNQARANS